MKVLILLLFGLMFSLKGFGQEGDTLVYASRNKLTWEDFRGKPAYADRSKGAEITVTINLKVKKVSFWSGKPTYDAYAIAFKDKSWVKSPYKDAYTLAHEQLHFDIAHIYAETLELQLNNLKNGRGEKASIDELLRESTNAMIAYQALYDKETQGGNNVAKQKEWARKIKEDLKLIN
ncbi:MAG: DUF922 domain-containing protein [Adhaeribacter sp.]